jgi:NAD(P)H dehydrogenase (quinone)
MKVLTIYAHPDPNSFNHALLEKFCEGLADAGHSNEVIDLYAIGFDPVLRTRDFPNWLPDANAPDVVEKVVRQRVLAGKAPLLQRIAAWRMFRNKSPLEVVSLLRERGPRDVREQQQKVADAQALVFIAPVWFVGFPAILKGWIERVFTLGFAYSLTSAGWHGDIGGRIPLLQHEKALIVNTTIFNEAAYRGGLGDAMEKLIDEFALHYPGIKSVEHAYFYAVNMAEEKTLQDYLARAYLLGRQFANPRVAAPQAAAAPRQQG